MSHKLLVVMVNPELEKRFIDSIGYLRGMDFFQDYSNLSSQEILEKIFRGGICYPISWWDEEKGHLYGTYLVVDFERNWRRWMKASDFEIDRELAPFDTKRVVLEDVKTVVSEKIGGVMLKRLARISRGIFQPTNISSKWLASGEKWSIQQVSFDFRDKRHTIEIALRHDYIEDMGLGELNELIRDTGYQYYQVKNELIMVVVLTKEEAEKLKKERGWEFEWII